MTPLEKAIHTHIQRRIAEWEHWCEVERNALHDTLHVGFLNMSRAYNIKLREAKIEALEELDNDLYADAYTDEAL